MGCLGTWRQTEVLESRLRQQEDALYALRSELDAKSSELAATRLELNLLRERKPEPGQTAIPAEHVEVVSRATGIRFHSLLTRPLDRDSQPGSDLLNVVVVPHDADHETVKLPGGVRLELLDLSKSEGERVVAAWDFKADEARERWHSGFIATGYRFELPWPETAPSGKLMLLARLTTQDGRHFEATQEIVAAAVPLAEQIVDSPMETAPSSGNPGPALLAPVASPHTAATTAPLGQAPTFDLPVLDTADQKAADDLPAPPRGLPWVDAGSDPFQPASAIQRKHVSPRPAPASATEPPFREIPIIPVPDQTGLETPFGTGQTEVEVPHPEAIPVAAPLPSDPSLLVVDTSVPGATWSVAAEPTETAAVASSASQAESPRGMVEPGALRLDDLAASAAPMHRIATTAEGTDRRHRFYRSRSATGYTPTMVLAPVMSATRQPDASAGIDQISDD
jgi:hypothetical protein